MQCILAVLVVTVREMMEMKQVLHLGPLHMWDPLRDDKGEGSKRTKMFLRLGGTEILVWWEILILCLDRIGECGIENLRFF